VYLIVEGDNLQKMLSGHKLFREWDGHNFMILSLLIFLPTLWLRNLSLLSYFSLVGATSAGFLWISVIVSGFDGGFAFHDLGLGFQKPFGNLT
jgi:amino acid permease